MQRVNNRLASAILSLYQTVGNLHSRNYYAHASELNYDNNNVYSLYFNVNLQGDTIELPLLCKDRVQGALISMLTETDMEGNPVNIRKDVTIPFCSNVTDSDIVTSRTADTLFRRLMDITPSRDLMFTKCTSNNGEVYYGSTGVIFNKDMTPIFFITIECDILHDDTNKLLDYKKVKTYVHPSVFYTENILEKCIVNKIIPYILSNGVYVYRGNPFIKDSCCRDSNEYLIKTKPEIIVSDFGDGFFYKPSLPSVDFKDEDINAFLKDNIDDVITCMK